MMNNTQNDDCDFGEKFPPILERQNVADATGLWFAAAVICAFLAAGVIVYWTANSEGAAPLSGSNVADADRVAPTQLVWPR